MADVAALRQRFIELNQNANWVPPEAVAHFALALGDVENLPYLDMTWTRENPPPRVMDVGVLVALTHGGVLIEVSYRNDDVGPVRMRSLRGRVGEIELAYDPDQAAGDRIPAPSFDYHA
jgi:hypothetical protein